MKRILADWCRIFGCQYGLGLIQNFLTLLWSDDSLAFSRKDSSGEGNRSGCHYDKETRSE